METRYYDTTTHLRIEGEQRQVYTKVLCFERNNPFPMEIDISPGAAVIFYTGEDQPVFIYADEIEHVMDTIKRGDTFVDFTIVADQRTGVVRISDFRPGIPAEHRFMSIVPNSQVETRSTVPFQSCDQSKQLVCFVSTTPNAVDLRHTEFVSRGRQTTRAGLN